MQDDSVEAVLAVGDARSVIRLLGKCAEIGDLDERRRYLLQGLADLIDAAIWMWAMDSIDPKTHDSMDVVLAVGGMSSDSQQAAFTAITQHHQALDLFYSPLLSEAFGSRRLTTRVRSDLCPDAKYLQSEFAADYAKVGLEDFLVAVKPLTENLFSGIGFHRLRGKGFFTARERCLVQVVLSEVSWLHGNATDAPKGKDKILELTSRQRQVLLLLLSGYGAKQIAAYLNLSLHTINDHLKSLHRHFNVSSRGELLSQFLTGGGALRRTP